ncbi:hypothetical protein GUJ93_ZPchr0009g1217 [Zizania palustris]|uniref:BZIP domain-containing protein n=1 Tax=Zizania palustris TaxID=103762 RepID=A0A8J5VMN8_ZIZPA|nr:hypothetical protein GUJ93_ZPchr0009g1217 [Zizania palustris]
MAMEDDEDIWANTTSRSASSPPPPAGEASSRSRSFISTALSLNSTRIDLLSSAFGATSPSHSTSNRNGGGDTAPSPAPFFSAFSNHLLAPPAPLDDGAIPVSARPFQHGVCAAPAIGDHRKKRMIKNRESAARSRARKQARVNSLEREVEQLEQENVELRVKYEQVVVDRSAPSFIDREANYSLLTNRSSLCSLLVRITGS